VVLRKALMDTRATGCKTQQLTIKIEFKILVCDMKIGPGNTTSNRTEEECEETSKMAFVLKQKN
jgi:hypothetical protein